VKFTPGAGRVTVSVAREGNVGVVHVRDTGIGIAPHVRERLFEPFFQGEDGLSRTLGGLGLGLTLTKGLVELHGGSIEVRSEGAGRGADFVVRLPLASAPPESPVAQPSGPRRTRAACSSSRTTPTAPRRCG